MASFELKILTEDPAELKGLVDKLCNTHGEPRKVCEGVAALGLRTHEEAKAVMEEVKEAHRMTDEQVSQAVEQAYATMPEHTNVAREPQDVPASVPERDAEGLKRDARIHSDAAEPFKADGTWKRKRNTPDDVYESVYEELAREAHAASLYKGSLLGQFELEARVVDTEQAPAPVVEQQAAPTPVVEQQAAPTPVVEQQAAPVAPVVDAAPAPAPVAPAPQAAPVAPAPAPQAAPAGLSAQVSASEQRCKDLLTSMIKQVGPTVAVASLRMFGGAHAITVLTPEQREQFCNVAEALIASGATAADGSDKLAEIAVLMGVAV
jgi:hypothetical protein